VRRGTACRKWCREKYGEQGAERAPRLDGMVFFNDDGSGVPRWEQQRYDSAACRRGVPPPRSVQGPRPQGCDEAMRRIGDRAAALITGGLPEC
jgi:hypothetical protein